MSADIQNKSMLSPAETLGIEQVAKYEMRTKSNLIRFLVVEYLRKKIDLVSPDVRAALVQEWDNS